MQSYKFPQIPRLFSAHPSMLVVAAWAERTLLWGGIVALGFVHAHLLTPQIIHTWNESIGAISYPAALAVHLDLAQTYWRGGNVLRAREELTLANGLTPPQPRSADKRVLGATSAPLDVLREWESEPDLLRNEYATWKTITAQKPDYRDAWIALGTLAYQLGKASEAKTFFTRAHILDPNDELTQKLLTLIP